MTQGGACGTEPCDFETDLGAPEQCALASMTSLSPSTDLQGFETIKESTRSQLAERSESLPGEKALKRLGRLHITLYIYNLYIPTIDLQHLIRTLFITYISHLPRCRCFLLGRSREDEFPRQQLMECSAYGALSVQPARWCSKADCETVWDSNR